MWPYLFSRCEFEILLGDLYIFYLFGLRSGRNNVLIKVDLIQSLVFKMQWNSDKLQRLSCQELSNVCSDLNVQIKMMGYFLERVLIDRERNRRNQEILCGVVDTILHVKFCK